MPAPFWVTIVSQEDDLPLLPLDEEPQDIDPIPPKTTVRLSKKKHRRGNYGAVLIWTSVSAETWALLINVSGGAGVDSADGFVRMPELEEETGVETWVDYACTIDKPQGGFSQTVAGRRSKVQLPLRDLRKIGVAS